MEYNTFYTSLLEKGLITPIWGYYLWLIKEDNESIKDEYLNLFAIYFSLIVDGNVGMSLDKNYLKAKWDHKVQGAAILNSDKEGYNPQSYDDLIRVSNAIIDQYLQDLNPAILPNLFGSHHLFDIDDNWLYFKKYYLERHSLMDSIKRLFAYENPETSSFKVEDCLKDTFKLKLMQEEIVTRGFRKNLIVTGGPGTGKTTSILCLLLNLLSANLDYEIYLVAPSGKASDRMKESIINNLKNLNQLYIDSHPDIIHKIENLDKSTIHKLLGIDFANNSFKHNKHLQFPVNAIFVVDEASMIDINVFSALLEAIPTGARLFIMGDKDQLPSVDSGAVFGELINLPLLKDNVVRLNESNRFSENTIIYQLADSINNYGRKDNSGHIITESLPVQDSDWRDYQDFEIVDLDKNDKSCPVYYYQLPKKDKKDKDIIESIALKWGEKFCQNLQTKSTDLDENDYKNLCDLFEETETFKILCAENEGPRGVRTINEFIKKNYIDKTKKTSVTNFYPGMLMIVNTNNHALDLDNGDSGILVTFKGDKTLYFMVNKMSKLIGKEGKQTDKIFKLGQFVFYPFRLITQSEIDMAYAITIHKSQGSDYKNILVVLPTKKGHPLLNKQIVYTAITRTKGVTYILSNQERLEEAAKTQLVRDTNLA